MATNILIPVSIPLFWTVYKNPLEIVFISLYAFALISSTVVIFLSFNGNFSYEKSLSAWIYLNLFVTVRDKHKINFSDLAGLNSEFSFS